MTILVKEYEERIAGNNRRYVKLKLRLICDECDEEFICPENTKARALKKTTHFCSKKCTKKSMAGGVIKRNIEKTNMQRYGQKSFTATKEFRDAFVANCIEKYGVKSHLEVPQILDKIKKTNLTKYGRPTFVGSDKHVSMIDFHEIAVKAWKTRLRRGQTKNISSKQEEYMYDLLCEEFGAGNVVRGKRLIRQFVDFYVLDIDTYIQVDGVYWHGLNRPVSEINKFSTRQDEKIYKQIFRDNKLNDYCKDNNIKLVRITDEECDSLPKSKLLNFIYGGWRANLRA
jgi:hypothetical protein